MKEIKDLAIVLISTEGIQHQSGGIARYNRNFIHYLVKVREVMKQYGINITLYAAEPALLRGLPTYNKKDFEEIYKTLENTGGKFYKLVNGTSGEDWIKDVENWKIMSAAAANVVLEVGQNHETTLAIFGGSCFALTQVYVHKQIRAFGVDVRTIFITHDSAFSTFYKEKDEKILAMDYLASVWTKFTPKAKIGYVSYYMKELFKSEYGVTENSFVAARSGITLTEQRFRRLCKEDIINILAENKIPLDKKIIFSWGRPIDYKRLDLIFSACNILGEDFYPVAITNGEFASLENYIASQGLRGSLVKNYKGFELMNVLLQWENCLAVCFLSESEPGAVTIMEAMYASSDDGPVVVANEKGVFKEVIENGKYGFITTNSPDEVAKTIRSISQYQENELVEMKKRAKANIINNYDSQKNYRNVLLDEFPFLSNYKDELLF